MNTELCAAVIDQKLLKPGDDDLILTTNIEFNSETAGKRCMTVQTWYLITAISSHDLECWPVTSASCLQLWREYDYS